MSVIKIQKRESPYIMVDKGPLDDNRLSWKAKGILVYLVGKPNDWEVKVADLINKSSDGRDSVYAGIEELIKLGYMTSQKVRDKGRFVRVDYTVYESPVTPQQDLPLPEKPLPEKPDTVKPDTENPPLTNKEETNKDFTNKEETNNTMRGAPAQPNESGPRVKKPQNPDPLKSQKKSENPDGTGAARTEAQQAVDLFLEVYRERRKMEYSVKWDRDIRQAKEILDYLARSFPGDTAPVGPLQLFELLLSRWPELEAKDRFYHENFTLTYINANTSRIISSLKAGKKSGNRSNIDLDTVASRLASRHSGG